MLKVLTLTSFTLTFWPTSIFHTIYGACAPVRVLLCLYLHSVSIWQETWAIHPMKKVQMLMFWPLLVLTWACWCWAQTFPSFSSSCTVDEVVVFSRLLLSFKACILKGVSSQCEPVKLAYCGEWGKKHQCVNFIWKPFLILTCYSFPSQFKKRWHILPHSHLIFKNVFCRGLLMDSLIMNHLVSDSQNALLFLYRFSHG